MLCLSNLDRSRDALAGPIPFNWVRMFRALIGSMGFAVKAASAWFVLTEMSTSELDATSWRSRGRNLPCFLVS